jgi:hypothetical protein
MKTSVENLLALSSPPLGQTMVDLPPELLDYQMQSPLIMQLAQMLRIKNGCFAFESALHIFPYGKTMHGYSLSEWNKSDLWRCEYESLTDDMLFFAEDLFGEQFVVHGNEVFRFNPETAKITRVAESIEGWADIITSRYKSETGYVLAHEWQVQNRRLKPEERLIPKLPFVLGGKFTVENLYAAESADGMRYRAAIAKQIHGQPDGTTVQIRII